MRIERNIVNRANYFTKGKPIREKTIFVRIFCIRVKVHCEHVKNTNSLIAYENKENERIYRKDLENVRKRTISTNAQDIVRKGDNRYGKFMNSQFKNIYSHENVT